MANVSSNGLNLGVPKNSPFLGWKLACVEVGNVAAPLFRNPHTQHFTPIDFVFGCQPSKGAHPRPTTPKMHPCC
jgi:hypothetical protein